MRILHDGLPHGQPHETLIQEYLALPLKDTGKGKWLLSW